MKNVPYFIAEKLRDLKYSTDVDEAASLFYISTYQNGCRVTTVRKGVSPQFDNLLCPSFEDVKNWLRENFMISIICNKQIINGLDFFVWDVTYLSDWSNVEKIRRFGTDNYDSGALEALVFAISIVENMNSCGDVLYLNR